MSRSRRKTPRWCPDSDKWSKRDWHQRMRAQIRICLHRFDADELLLPQMREVSNVWAMAKDGSYRFDPREFPELMRK